MKKMLALAAMLAGATAALAATRITTRAELAAITNNLAGAYELGCDIDLAGEPWTPIGNGFHKFTGSLDGCGHVISNLTVTADSSNYGAAQVVLHVRDARGAPRDLHAAHPRGSRLLHPPQRLASEK